MRPQLSFPVVSGSVISAWIRVLVVGRFRQIRHWGGQTGGAMSLVVLLCLLATPVTLPAADEAFVGVLALAVDPKVAKDLGIDDELRDKLAKLVDERENEAVELALQIKDLPVEERAAKLQPFVAVSEAKGLALLTEKQRVRLHQMRVERAGLSTLADAKIAEQVGLGPTQREQVNKIIQQRTAAMAQGGDAERRLAHARFERELAGVLTVVQRRSWEQLAGLAAAEAATDTDENPAKTTEKVADTSKDKPLDPAAEKPSAKPGEKATVVADNGKSKAGEPRAKSADGRLRFSFRYAPWKDVLDWFATQADYSLIMDTTPPGTFNYTDTRAFTPTEAIDLLNGVLLTKGFTLIRRERLLMVWNQEDEIPEPLMELVTPSELDQRGKYELVRCIFPLQKLTPEDAEKEISKLIGPLGRVNALTQAKQLVVRETAGKLRAIRDVLEAIENPPGGRNEQVSIITLKYMPLEAFMSSARPLLGMPENTNQTPDGSLRVSLDPLNSRILAVGKLEKFEKLVEIQRLLDVESAKPIESNDPLEQPQLEVYPPNGVDALALLDVVKVLMAGQADVRLASDPKTGNLVALARPSQHATIRATLDQMQRDTSQVDVFLLRRVDPQVAVLAINKLFGMDEKEKNSTLGAPRVESDATSRQLFVRGTPAQVAQIKSLLQKMGEGETMSGGPSEPAERGNVRTLPLSGRAARTVLEEVEALWPVMRANRIRVVRPSSDVPQLKLREDALREDANPVNTDASTRRATNKTPGIDDSPVKKPLDLPAAAPGKPAPAPKLPGAPRNARSDSRSQTLVVSRHSGWEQLANLVAWQDSKTDPAPAAAKPDAAAKPAVTKPAGEKSTGEKPVVGTPKTEKPEFEKPAAAKLRRVAPATPNQEFADIVIVIGPRDITIASEDLEALDAFEELIRTLADRTLTSGGETTVFYLRYAVADAAAALLLEVLGGGGGEATGGGGGGGGGLFGDLASSMLGDMGGGLLGNLLGGGGSGGGGLGTSGSRSIIPDARLNALFVKANSQDLDTIEQLLKVIDQENSPENPEIGGKPRFIQIFNTTAEEVAVVVRQVFSSRIAADASQPRQPSPQDLMQALRGGGRGNSRQQAKSEPAKMLLGVDPKSNALIVSAPEQLYLEVKALAEQLDHAAVANRDESIRTVVLRGGSNPQVIQRALSSLTGGAARAATATSGAGGQMPGGGPPGGNPGGGFPGGMFPGGGAAGGMGPANIQQMIPGGGGGGRGGVGGGGGNRGAGGGGRGGMGGGGAPF